MIEERFQSATQEYITVLFVLDLTNTKDFVLWCEELTVPSTMNKVRACLAYSTA
jgi:hypothetical protein